jgi:hypothetical protein
MDECQFLTPDKRVDIGAPLRSNFVPLPIASPSVPAYRSRRHNLVCPREEFEYSRIVLRVVRLHRSCGLRALAAKAQVKMTDALDVSAVVTSQDDPFRNLTDCVHDSTLLFPGKLDAVWEPVE